MKIKTSRTDGVTLQYVPCGHCRECRKSYQNQWAFRMMSDCVAHDKWALAFGTLTYGTKKGGYPREMTPFIPQILFKGGEYEKIPCFNKKHTQELFKSLRDYLFSRSRSYERTLLRARYKKYLRSFGSVGDYERAREYVRANGHDVNVLKYSAWKKLNPITDEEHSHIYYDGENTPIWLCCSEYGGERHRPHYHFLILWNATNEMWNPIDATELHHFMQDWWQSRYGFMFPKYAGGGWNGSNTEKPFVIPHEDGRFLGAVKYVCKYVCKDIDYENNVPASVDVKEPAYKNCCSFHIQSRQLGMSLLKNKTDVEKLDLLINGYKFDGEEHSRGIPVYLRDKIIFDNKYILEEGTQTYKVIETDETGVLLNENIVTEKCLKRLVRKEANQFFIKYHHEIFDKKVKYYEKIICSLCDPVFYTNGGCEVGLANDYSQHCRRIVDKYGRDNIATWYVSGFSRNEYVIPKIKPCELFLSRYVPENLIYDTPCDHFNPSYVRRMNRVTSLVFGFASLISKARDSEEAKDQRTWKSFNLEPRI